MKKYVKEDYTRVLDGRARADGVKLTCHTLTDKLIDFSQGELGISGYIKSATGNALAGATIIGIQTGFYSILIGIKISFNND